jgi:Restriction Endonuclease associating with ARP/Domain of unknown function (DUF3470)
MYLLRQRPDLAKAVLRAIDPEVVEAEIVDDGYVEFEFIGARQYLTERASSRGANCTSVDAFMIGRTAHDARRAFLMEWKYTEAYRREDKYIPERARVYDDLVTAEDSPFKQVEPRALYFEPFYQMMRQTLLGWQISELVSASVLVSGLRSGVLPEVCPPGSPRTRSWRSRFRLSRKAPPPDSKEWEGKPDKLQYFLPNPGAGD